MRAEELRQILDRRPFEPIRLTISGGQHVDIVHPENATLSRSIINVAVGGEDGIGDRMVWYNLLHIISVEPIETAGGKSNGTPVSE